MPSFVDRPDCLAVFLEKILETRWKPQPQSNTNNNANDETGKTNNNNILTQLTPSEQEERKAIWNTLLELYLMDEQPHPTTSTSITTTNNNNNSSSPNSQQQSNQNQNTLTQREKLKRAKEFKAKSLALLKDETVQYDTNQALVLCQLKKFDEGIVYLYEKTEMYTDILRFWMEKQETDKVIEAVRKYGY